LIALLRTSKKKVARTITAGYIGIFQGTPLLMQLFVVYYGVALLGVEVNAWIAVAIAFTLHASAFLGEIWRGSIEA
ncbi:MAG: amino acid ABC transporter permease, partial [Mesorhizobium sp.]